MENNKWRYTWTPQSAEWYEDADDYTGYNQKLAEKIKRYLEPTDHVFELACGTGRLAKNLTPFVSRYTANDMDDSALAVLESDKPDNLTVVKGDWHEVGKELAPFDVTVFQQFSGILKNWDLLKSITKRQVIAVLPSGADAVRHHKQPGSEKTAASAGGIGSTYNPFPDNGRPHLESYESCAAFLDERDIPYHLITMTMDFGQPFRDLKEAYAFFQHYYALTKTGTMPAAMSGKDLQPIDHPKFKYYYPKEREVGILIASTEG